MACQFLTGVILARALGPAGLGIYALATALAQLLAIAAQFGFPGFLVRSVALQSGGPGTTVASLISGSGAIVLAISTLMIAIVALVTWVSGVRLVDIPSSSLVAALILVPLLALSATLSAALRGLGYVVGSQFATEVARPILLLVVVSGLYFLGQKLTPGLALLLNGGALVVAVGLLIHSLRQHLPSFPRPRAPVARYLGWIGGSFPFVLLAGAQVLNYHADLILLGLLSTRDQVGLYRVALQIADGVGVVLFAISLTVAPEFARLHAAEEMARLQKLLTYAHRAATAVIAPLAITLALLGGWLLRIIYGQEYVGAHDALTVLVLGKIAYATVCYSGVALSMIGRATSAAVISLISLIANVAMNVVLIPRYGIVGAAWATAISEFFVAAAGSFYLYRVAGAAGLMFCRQRPRAPSVTQNPAVSHSPTDARGARCAD